MRVLGRVRVRGRVRGRVLVPGLAGLGPDGFGTVPGIGVGEVVGCGALFDGQGVEVFVGELGGALESVFDLDFVLCRVRGEEERKGGGGGFEVR